MWSASLRRSKNPADPKPYTSAVSRLPLRRFPGPAILALVHVMACVLVADPAKAQDGDFRVALEMIVFLQLDPEESTEELVQTSPDLPPPEVFPAPLELPDSGPATPRPPAGILALTRAQFALDGIWLSMRRSAGYRPLAHLAWAMPAQWTGEPAPLRLSTLAAGPLPFTGLASLEEERFVHLMLDLRMPAVEEGDGEYRIRERRRLLLGEIHYFDHPRFGAVVRLFRYRPRPDADD